MKRWQDRGEVLDSDEENLSLCTKSPSPLHQRKRPRLGDNRTEPLQDSQILRWAIDSSKHGNFLNGVPQDQSLPDGRKSIPIFRHGDESGEIAHRSTGAGVNFESDGAKTPFDDADDEGAWLDSRPIKTYGRSNPRLRLSSPILSSTQQHHLTKHDSRKVDRPCLVSAHHVSSSKGADFEEYRSPTASLSDPTNLSPGMNNFGGQHASSIPTSQSTLSHIDTANQAKAHEQTESHDGPLSWHSSPQRGLSSPRYSIRSRESVATPSPGREPPSSDSEGLPELRDVLRNQPQHIHKQPFTRPQTPSEAPSSPLSERDETPEAPAFLLLRSSGLPGRNSRGPMSAPDNNRLDSSSDVEDMPSLIDQQAIAALTRENAGGRNLRRRKDIQLHPYMFDLAQHRLQFSRTGMRPVRLLREIQRDTHTQDASVEGDVDSSQMNAGSLNSSPQHSSSQVEQESSEIMQRHPSLDDGSIYDMPDSGRATRRAIAEDMRKGRKHLRTARVQFRSVGLGRHSVASQDDGFVNVDDLEMPPSPPPTSSMSPESHTLPSGFRIPHIQTQTPNALPTPQISSDAGPERRILAQEDSESDAPRSRRRTRTSSRQHREPRTAQSSAESSDVESSADPDVDERRLQTERRRIKGVLPASWLKIDFKAQRGHGPASPTHQLGAGSVTSPPSRPQRGVAQIVSRTTGMSSTALPLVISDDSAEDSDQSNTPIAPATLQQATLPPPIASSTMPSIELVDDDDMEVDTIDRMLAPQSRKLKKSMKARQPRIKDAFRKLQKSKSTLDRIEGHRSLRDDQGLDKHRSRQSRRPRRPNVPNLSIIDAPASQEANTRAPHFIRLAKRTARHQKSHGRHSPTQKVIRLPTEADNNDALATLQSWREGNIAPRVFNQTPALHEENGDISTKWQQQMGRPPLVEISSNGQRQLSPSGEAAGEKKRSRRATIVHVRRPQFQQTLLQPTRLAHTQDDNTTADRMKRKKPGKGSLQRNQPHAVRSRGAQLETLETDFDRDHRLAAFEDRMRHLVASASRKNYSGPDYSDQMKRFLQSENNPAVTDVTTYEDKAEQELLQQRTAQQPRPVRRRKHSAKRIDIEGRQYRQPSEPLPIVDLTIGRSEDPVASNTYALLGLEVYGTKYPTDFDIKPLEVGTYFHDSTFIGSSEFSDAINLAQRDLDQTGARVTVHVEGEALVWAAWTEEVSAGLSKVSIAIGNTLVEAMTVHHEHQAAEALAAEQTVQYLFRSVVRYFSRCVWFLDAIDRQACVLRIVSTTNDLIELLERENFCSKNSAKLVLTTLMYALTISNQAHIISDHPLVQEEMRSHSQQLVHSVGMLLAKHLISQHYNDLRAFYDDNKQRANRENGIRDADSAITALVVLNHIVSGPGPGQRKLWQLLNERLSIDSATEPGVQALERVWCCMFTSLPALEIDSIGIAQIGSRLTKGDGDWSFVKCLLERLFDLYTPTSIVPGSTINEYIRANLMRCHALITRWGWWRCESILYSVFDFFGRRGLALLHREESRGSPKFLEELADNPSFETQKDDTSFVAFLKILITGIQGMRKHNLYDDRKLGSIIWRLIPNHGRTYPRDAEVRQTDLAALCNHHDLLSALYYAAPRTKRPRIDLFSNLVDHTTSHRQACRINVRAWSNITCFQASTQEPLETLDPLVDWYDNVLRVTIAQYRLARTEAEQQFAVAKAQGVAGVTEELLESTIAGNQRQISATIVDCLAALKHAIRSSCSMSVASKLTVGSNFWRAFDLFESTERRTHAVMLEALEVTRTVTEVQEKLAQQVESQQTSEESQDYGDSTALQELITADEAVQFHANDIADTVQEPVWHLLSNAFGAETAPDDTVLAQIIDVWILLTKNQVQKGKAAWDSYINDYSSTSWTQLRETEQRRKFEPYYIAQILKHAGDDLHDLWPTTLTAWLRSLVEREAALKHQHVLTAALLERGPNEVLLTNLPFAKCRDGGFKITLQELRQRRLGLISSLLSNMSDAVETASTERKNLAHGFRRIYGDMLRQMMQAMKTNYQSLQPTENDGVASITAQGAYVDFVQQVVAFLQQYTTEICSIDRFFTDSAAFPLPATDPMYVVGRLRSYVTKLSDAKARKQLAVFVHTVSERATVDGQQSYLVRQLHAAAADVAEHGNWTRPSLRFVLMTSIFPAYMEQSMSSACAWVFAESMLKASTKISAELLIHTRLADSESCQATVEMLKATLQSTIRPVCSALDHVGQLGLPHVLRLLAATFEAANACLTPAEYLMRTSKADRVLARLLSDFHMLADIINELLLNTDGYVFMESIDTIGEVQLGYQDTLGFARDQVKKSLGSEWYSENGRYLVRRGHVLKEVRVDLQDEQVEKERLIAAVTSFCMAWNAIFATRGGWRSRAFCSSSLDCNILGLTDLVM